jgi:hypothetical protein
MAQTFPFKISVIGGHVHAGQRAASWPLAQIGPDTRVGKWFTEHYGLTPSEAASRRLTFKQLCALAEKRAAS